MCLCKIASKITVKGFNFSKVADLQLVTLLNNELLHSYFSSNLTLDFRASFFKNTLRWLLLKYTRYYFCSIYVFSLEVTGNANLLRNVKHQKASSSQEMTNLRTLWLKMPKVSFSNQQLFRFSWKKRRKSRGQYSAIYVFSLEVTGNANLLQNVQHQKATSSQEMTNLRALWLKMPKVSFSNQQLFKFFWKNRRKSRGQYSRKNKI